MENIVSIYKKDFEDYEEKIVQFGEGNFLRAFADYYVEMANQKGVFNGRVVAVIPTERGKKERLNSQNSLYTTLIRGKENGKIVDDAFRISSVSRCISAYEDKDELVELFESENIKIVISNTTEAGITFDEKDAFNSFPSVSYPAKLTYLLYKRFKKLGMNSGLLILPVELIENNGFYLKKYVLDYAKLWNLENNFAKYIENECKFCSTLVDRIVTGFPKNDYEKITKKLGYEDNCLDVSEPYNCWIIEGKDEWKDIFPIYKAGLNIIWTDDMSPYRERKVRILNGAHTMSVLAAYLGGFDIVRDVMQDELFLKYIKKGLFEQVIPTINLDEKELADFANAVLERFDNPFIDHRLLDISLNSVSKYKARCLDTVLDYKKKTGKLPNVLVFGLSALIAFYNGKYDENGIFCGTMNNEKYEIRDSKEVTDYFEKAYKTSDVVKEILENKDFWGNDLTEVSGLYEMVSSYFEMINENGILNAVKSVTDYE